MLVINQKVDKLITCHMDFNIRHMLDGLVLKPIIQYCKVPAPILPLIILIIDDSEVEGPQVMATVTLSKTPGKV